MKFVIIIALFAAVATAEEARDVQPHQRLFNIVGAIIAGLLTPKPIVNSPAIVDTPIGNPIWDGPVIVDGPVVEGPVIAEYPEFDSPISVGPVIIDEPIQADAPTPNPMPVFPFPVTSPLVQLIVNVDSNSAGSKPVSIEQPTPSDNNLVDVSPVITPGGVGIHPRQA